MRAAVRLVTLAPVVVALGSAACSSSDAVGAGALGDGGAPPSETTRDGGGVPVLGEDAGVSEAGAPPARRGWEISATNIGLAGLGLTCEGLPLYDGPEKPAKGSVISGKRVESGLDLSAGNIVVERSCVRPKSVGRGLPVLTTTDFNSCDDSGCAVAPALVTIRDSEVDGSLLSTELAAYATGFLGIATIERTYIHHFGSGIGLMNTGLRISAEITNNYVTDLVGFGDPATTGNHSDGFTIRDFDTSKDPARRLVVNGNRFDCDSKNSTGAFFIQTYAGNIENVRLEHNLLEGLGYQLALEEKDGNTYANMSAVDNRFSGTGFGATYRTGGPGWTTWTDNHLDDPSSADHKGKAVSAP